MVRSRSIFAKSDAVASDYHNSYFVSEDIFFRNRGGDNKNKKNVMGNESEDLIRPDDKIVTGSSIISVENLDKWPGIHFLDDL